MEIQSILKASFAVPAIEPDWQSGLLMQLETVEAAAKPEEVSPALPALEAVFVDMGQGSREQQYRRQRPVLRIVTSTRGR